MASHLYKELCYVVVQYSSFGSGHNFPPEGSNNCENTNLMWFCSAVGRYLMQKNENHLKELCELIY